jgi:hypothetical protein
LRLTPCPEALLAREAGPDLGRGIAISVPASFAHLLKG